MVNLTINRKNISVPEGTTILDAALSNGIKIPHLCYMKELNEIGACRLCSVEVEGEDKLIPACITKVREGMVVTADSHRVRIAARTNLAFIMSKHDGRCSSCIRSQNCQLQDLCNSLSLDLSEFYEHIPSGRDVEWPENFPLIRDSTKCIQCMRCIQVCNKIQGMNVWGLIGSGSWSHVGVSNHKKIEEADCTLCGQCITHCPTAALHERNDIGKVKKSVENPDIVTVVQIAPAIRTAWGEHFGLSPKEATVEKMAGCLHTMGFDYVVDTSFGADLTIMEEATEFLERKQKGDLDQYPMFTSCCPGWVRFIKARYPELVGQLSTSKSPQTMLGAIIKSYFAEKKGIDPAKIRVTSIMPCVAKKQEADLPTERNKDGLKDVDYVLTTREVARMLGENNIDPRNVEDYPFDSLLGDYTGAGVIFGVTGGVMEAALRSASFFVTGEKPDIDMFHEIRSDESEGKTWREMTCNVGGNEPKIAVTSGLKNTDELCRAILKGDVKYDFVEIMACPGGCSGGGGQPVHTDDVERGLTRGAVLHELDRSMPLRYSHENPDIQKLYSDYLGKPLSEKAEELLHTDHFGWEMNKVEE